MKELVIKIEPQHSWLRNISLKHEVFLKILDCRVLSKCDVQTYFRMNFNPSNFERIINDIKNASDVIKFDYTTEGEGIISGIVTTSRCTACKIIADSNCFIKGVLSRDQNWVEWILIGRNKNINKVLKKLEEKGINFEISKLTEFQRKGLLSTKQERVIYLAYKLGYFDFPRKISLEELSRKLGISKATLNEILRRGLKNILKDYFYEK